MNCPTCYTRIRIARYDGRCAECGGEYLQPYALQCLRHWRFVTWPHASGRIPRNGPTEGFHTKGRKGPYLFACKKRLHNDRYASFSTTLIAAALTANPVRKLALFVGPGPYDVSDVTVFDAKRVANHAEERTTVDSKRERDVPIFDVSALAHGVPLGDHLSGAKRLPGPAEDAPAERTLGEWVSV